MKRRSRFSLEIFVVAILVICFLCCGGMSLPLYVFPQISEQQAEGLRQDADQLRERDQKRKEWGEKYAELEVPESQWPPTIRSLEPDRVWVVGDDVYVFFHDLLGLSRGIVIVPDKVARTGPGGEKEYHYLSHRVYRIVIWWD